MIQFVSTATAIARLWTALWSNKHEPALQQWTTHRCATERSGSHNVVRKTSYC